MPLSRSETRRCGEPEEGRPEGSAAAVVVAAGTGIRFGAPVGKFLVSLAGKPLLFYALRTLEESLRIEEIVVVVPPGMEGEAEEKVIHRFSFKKVCGVIAGGPTRGDSVWAGLSLVSKGIRTVLIHDGARPLVPADLVDRVLDAADRLCAAVPGVESVDTLKRVEGDITVATLDRSRIRRVQTPQGFHLSLLWKAYEEAIQAGDIATDDSTLVERAGATVKVVPGSELNFKITTPEDLELAEAILATRE